jgi:hypothetical protein
MRAPRRLAVALFLLALAALAGHLGAARGEDPPAPAAVPSAEVERAFDVLRRAIGQQVLPAAPVAAPAAGGPLRTTFSDEELLVLLRKLDPGARIERPARLWFTVHGQNILVSNQGAAGLQIIHILQGFPGQVEFANRWNVNRRFTSCSIDQDGDWWLELDVPLWGGVSAFYIEECLDLFQSSLSAYLEELRAIMPPAAPEPEVPPVPDNR